MKKVHLYKLKAEFKDGHKINLKIVASDISWLTCHINDMSSLNSFHADIIKENYAVVKDENFGSSDWTPELEKSQKRWMTI